MEKTGVCPIRSDEIFSFVLNVLIEDDTLPQIPDEILRKDAEALKNIFPDYYLPDIYIDLPLTGGAFRGMAVVMNCYDRCYIDHASKGTFFTDAGIDPLNAPENRDDLLVLVNTGTGPETSVLCQKMKKTERLAEHEEASGDLAGLSVLNDLAVLPLRYLTQPCAEGLRLIFTTGDANPRIKYTHRAYKEEIRKILSAAGCTETAADALDKACFNCGVPYLDGQSGYEEWPACLDVAAFSLTVKKGKILDCHALIGISDRSMHYSWAAVKRTQSYQWHITDNCDQRCKHCYLYAEDARLACVTTPFDQLLLTLDEIEKDAEARNAVAMPAVSGGDPLLHPDFWRFAEELHERGMRWLLMGNPFHLDEKVCRRLYELGCFKYQLSMDGLREFHDHMRKKGSFQATLDAVKLLNEAGIQTQLMATVSRQNMEDVLACMDIAAEHKVTDFTFARYCATSPEKAAEAYPSPEEYRSFLLRYYEKAKEYKEKQCLTRFKFKEHLFTLLEYELGTFRPTEYSKKHPEIIFGGCHLGQNCTILANGDLMACRRMESVIGNVKTESIHDIQRGEKCAAYRKITDISKCKNCELLQWCRGCRAVGYNATGDLQGEDPCCWK